MKRLIVMLAVLAAALYVGCKQGEGDRCQVNEDCSSGECNMATGTCSTGNEQMPIDAPLIIDVPEPLDAAPDAAPDAMPDAS